MTKISPIFGSDNIEKMKKYVYQYLDDRVKDLYRHFDIYPYLPMIDLFKKEKDKFIILNSNYYFHIPTGFLVHVPKLDSFANIKNKQLAVKPIMRKNIIIPGRFLGFARRIIPGVRGGKYKLICTLTHISVLNNPKIIRNKITRAMLIKSRLYVKKNVWVYPDYYDVMKKYKFKPLRDIVDVIYDTPYIA